MEIVGKVKKINELQTFGSGFQKRELIITTNEQYPQHVSVEFVQDKISLLDALKIGDEIKISINIRGREWINPEGEAKYFNSIVGWRIEKMTPITANYSDNQAILAPPAPKNFAPSQENIEDDDLPF